MAKTNDKDLDMMFKPNLIEIPLSKLPDTAPAPVKKQKEKVAVLKANGEVAKPRRFSIYLTPEDEQLLRGHFAFLSSQGRRATDSNIIRAALHGLPTGDELLGAYDNVTKRDGRLKKVK
jgi:hypothetical protein